MRGVRYGLQFAALFWLTVAIVVIVAYLLHR